MEDGYEFFGKRGLVTIFSAPNYCGEFDNAGAIMNVDRNLLCSFQVSTRSLNAFPQTLGFKYLLGPRITCEISDLEARAERPSRQAERFLRASAVLDRVEAVGLGHAAV